MNMEGQTFVLYYIYYSNSFLHIL